MTMLETEKKFSMTCSSDEYTKLQKQLCKSMLHHLYSSGKDFAIIKGRLIILKGGKTNMYETTKNIIALLFVVAAIASYFFTW